MTTRKKLINKIYNKLNRLNLKDLEELNSSINSNKKSEEFDYTMDEAVLKYHHKKYKVLIFTTKKHKPIEPISFLNNGLER